MKKQVLPSDSSKAEVRAADLAIALPLITFLLLASLHFMSPEFDPSFRMISEYAFGRYGWVLSLMFLALGSGTWALAIALRSHIKTRAAKAGWWILIIAGLGQAMAAIFDIRHEVAHGIAGLLGVLGFPLAAVLLSVGLGRLETWRPARKAILWLANLNWIAVILLIATLVLMTIQMTKANGGHLPAHAPKQLPPGVIGLPGWADRLIILTNCLWLITAAWQTKNFYGKSGYPRDSMIDWTRQSITATNDDSAIGNDSN